MEVSSPDEFKGNGESKVVLSIIRYTEHHIVKMQHLQFKNPYQALWLTDSTATPESHGLVMMQQQHGHAAL